VLLLRLENKKAREWYIAETIRSSWSVSALERQIGTHYYERLLSSKETKSDHWVVLLNIKSKNEQS